MSDEDAEDRAAGSPRQVAQDAMFSVHRVVTPGSDAEPEPRVPFRIALSMRHTFIEGQFTARNWPPFAGRVLVTHDGEDWEPVPPEWEEQWAAMGLNPRLEMSPPARVGLERSIDFIHRRLEPLTLEYWLLSEARAIRRVLDAPSQDEALLAAHALGELHERVHLQGLHLPSLTVARRVQAGARAGGAARRGALSPHTATILAAMRALESDGHTVLRAAELAAKRGLGTSAGANHKLWYRHPPPKL